MRRATLLAASLLAVCVPPLAVPARAETPAPNAAGTATTTTRQAPETGAGAHGSTPPPASVGGAISGQSDPAEKTGRNAREPRR